MHKNSPDVLSLIDEINKCKTDLNYLIELSKQNESLKFDSNEFISLREELNFLKKQINSIKIINEKIIDYLLLEITSSNDKYNMQINKDVKLKEIKLLKNELKEKDDNISSLKEEIFVLKSIIDEKDKTINSLRV